MSSSSPNQTQTQPTNPAQSPAQRGPPPPPQQQQSPIPWTHEETINLIKAYQHKWYSLNRGQLRASQWDDVSLSIASRCSLVDPPKSGTQCRHKMEKLRKRYRAEKLKNPTPSSSSSSYHHSWIYFPLMHHLEHGIVIPENIGIPYLGHGIQHDLRHGHASDFEENEEDEYEGGGFGGEMRGFVERYVKIERKKMEIMRENERYKIDMENKRLEMILVSHQKIIDLISKVFDEASNNKKMKLSPPDL